MLNINICIQLCYKFKIWILFILKFSILAQSRPVHTYNLEWTQYHSLEDINSWMDAMILNHFPHVRGIVIGYSYEGRPIRGLKLSKRRGNKAIFLESSIHAIEWISSATSTCFFNQLLTSNSIEMKELSESYDWHYIPVMNPDGFIYSHNVVSSA